MLKGQPSFAAVLEELLSWIGDTVNEMDQWQGIMHYPLLVAHNGFVLMVIAEMQRRDMSSSSFLYPICILPIPYMIANY